MGMPSPQQIVEALKDYAVPLVQHGDWIHRGTKYAFTPVGHINHHDVLSEAVSDAAALKLMVNGRPDLSGPLCNGWGDSDGTYYLISYGNANHAGRGEKDVLDRTRAGLAPLGDARLDPDTDGPVGNTWYWGSEWRNTGTGRDPYEQLDTMVRVNAALADLWGWDSATSIAHREWTSRKIDVAGIFMPEFRRLIAEARAVHNATPTTPEEEEEMAKNTLNTRDAKAQIKEWYVDYLGREPTLADYQYRLGHLYDENMSVGQAFNVFLTEAKTDAAFKGVK